MPRLPRTSVDAMIHDAECAQSDECSDFLGLVSSHRPKFYSASGIMAHTGGPPMAHYWSSEQPPRLAPRPIETLRARSRRSCRSERRGVEGDATWRGWSDSMRGVVSRKCRVKRWTRSRPTNSLQTAPRLRPHFSRRSWMRQAHDGWTMRSGSPTRGPSAEERDGPTARGWSQFEHPIASNIPMDSAGVRGTTRTPTVPARPRGCPRTSQEVRWDATSHGASCS